MPARPMRSGLSVPRIYLCGSSNSLEHCGKGYAHSHEGGPPLAANDDMDCTVVVVWMGGALYAQAFPVNASSAGNIAIPVSNDFVMIVPPSWCSVASAVHCADTAPQRLRYVGGR
jgi:hypothetical protein